MGSVTWLAPAVSVTGEQAVNRIGRSFSRSANVPDALVGTAIPLTLSCGPRPQGSLNGTDGVVMDGTPGIVTSLTSSGAWTGVKTNRRLAVFIGLNFTTPPAPSVAPRAWPPDPMMSSWAGPDAPGGLAILTRLTVRA